MEEDDLSTHVVVSSASRIIGDLFDKKFPGLSWVDVYIKTEHKGEFLSTLRSKYNFLKHADSDPKSLIDIKNLKKENWGLILFSIWDFRMLFPNDWSIWLSMFLVYLGLKYPKFIKKSDDNSFPNQLQAVVDRLKQLIGNEDIDRYFRDMVLELSARESDIEALLGLDGLSLKYREELA